MLRKIQDAFVQSQPEIQIQAFESWRYFLWVISTNMPLLLHNKKRLDLTLMPIHRAYVFENKQTNKQTNNDYIINICWRDPKLLINYFLAWKKRKMKM
jgi:hypothetical protein